MPECRGQVRGFANGIPESADRSTHPNRLSPGENLNSLSLEVDTSPSPPHRLSLEAHY